MFAINKASGPDGVSHRMLKFVSNTLCIPLCILVNMSLRQCVYPSLWKAANVMPLFKKGDISFVSNYRPISLISCVGKVFERILFKRIDNFIIDNSLLYSYQSGFLPSGSLYGASVN